MAQSLAFLTGPQDRDALAGPLGHERVLGVYAHPDDADVGAGATIARLVREGAQVALLVATLGDAGGFEADGQEYMPHVRRAEQEAAARCLGVSEVTFLEGFLDGHVSETPGLVREVVAAIRRWKPSLVLSMSPEYNFEALAANHPDHRAVGRAVVDAAYPGCGNPFDYRDLLAAGLEPHEIEEVWFQGHRETNHVVAVSEADLEAKVAAVRCHTSQFKSMDRMEAFIRERAVYEAQQIAAPSHAAESFFCWKLRH